MSSQYASLGRRLIAAFLDILIVSIPLVVLGHVIPVLGPLIVLFFYLPIMESSELRATLGKYWMGIQVTDPEGRRISLQSALLRNALKILSPALLFLGCLVALFNDRKQTLHDLLAESIVVYGRNDYAVATAWSDSVRELFSRHFFRAEPDALGRLERLQALKEKGALTEEEFATQKKAILEQTKP